MSFQRASPFVFLYDTRMLTSGQSYHKEQGHTLTIIKRVWTITEDNFTRKTSQILLKGLFAVLYAL